MITTTKYYQYAISTKDLSSGELFRLEWKVIDEDAWWTPVYDSEHEAQKTFVLWLKDGIGTTKHVDYLW